MKDAFSTHTTLTVRGRDYRIHSLRRLEEILPDFEAERLPYSLKILLENLLRCQDGASVDRGAITALCHWDPLAEPSVEIAFTPGRVLLQDFTGVPAVVDLAAMRDAMVALGGDPKRINPLAPVELVIDHSVQVDVSGRSDAPDRNAEIEFERNRERYAFLGWGQKAFSNLSVVPPDTGIVHQINLECLARVVSTEERGGVLHAFPDTVVGTDSHTTMINGLGVLGWGVGGIEAEAAMLGQPISMLIPQVVGCRLMGDLPEGATATDLVLAIVQRLRAQGVVGKFVEFFGEGLDRLPLAERATIANMAPEYGATCGIFPIDEETLRYLALSGRSEETVALVKAYAEEQGFFRATGQDREGIVPQYSQLLEVDLSQVEPCIAGPKRPQDRILLKEAKPVIEQAMVALQEERSENGNPYLRSVTVEEAGRSHTLWDGALLIAAITSCTNTSNPAVMIGAGLLARNARRLGLAAKPWVKTSLAPGSLVVSRYLQAAGLQADLDALGFQVVGYGCTTCIGNSGPLMPGFGDAARSKGLITAAVLSGNRNFEGRIHAEIKMNFLASPPLVVAYALAGRVDIDLEKEALGKDPEGKPVYLRDIQPSREAVRECIERTVTAQVFQSAYQDIFQGDARWQSLQTTDAQQFSWSDASTYIRNPPYFRDMAQVPEDPPPIRGARVLALLGDSITTDHISPAGTIGVDTPAGRYLRENGVAPGAFNSYGSRRGNHEVMVRGTFANPRLRNRLTPDIEGGFSLHVPSGEIMPLYDCAMRYDREKTPLIVMAGKEYGSGSSRDWAAKGTRLLGIRAVIAQSYERIHRSNLVGMGILPLAFPEGEGPDALGLDGREVYDFEDPEVGARTITVTAHGSDGHEKQFRVQVRIDTPKEWEYYRHGGILPFVLRGLRGGSQ